MGDFVNSKLQIFSYVNIRVPINFHAEAPKSRQHLANRLLSACYEICTSGQFHLLIIAISGACPVLNSTGSKLCHPVLIRKGFFTHSGCESCSAGYNPAYARTLSLPLPLMNQITINNFVTIIRKPDCAGIASAQNYGKISVRV